VESLKIQVKEVRIGPVQQRLTLPGRVMVPQGHEVTVTAPVSGYVRAPEGGAPRPGEEVKEGRALFQLEPVLAPLEQIQLVALKRGMENEMAKARESVRVAESELERVTELHNQKLRGQQDLEQAQARLKHAREDLESARDKLKLFDKPANSGGHLPPLPILAPRAGTVLAVPVSPGQYVTATAPLTTVADLKQLWLRVPIPEADLPRIDQNGTATVTVKGKKDLHVTPLGLVPLVDLARQTADLIYVLPPEAKERGLVARDQLAMVDVPLDQRREEAMVPYDAVVFDAHAGAWIYLDKTPAGAATHVYERRKVQLGPTKGKEVAVRDAEGKPACAKGGRVVVEGAGAVFSSEFFKPPQK
jgi:RND family efflux transporter MFP subunit